MNFLPDFSRMDYASKSADGDLTFDTRRSTLLSRRQRAVQSKGSTCLKSQLALLYSWRKKQGEIGLQTPKL